MNFAALILSISLASPREMPTLRPERPLDEAVDEALRGVEYAPAGKSYFPIPPCEVVNPKGYTRVDASRRMTQCFGDLTQALYMPTVPDAEYEHYVVMMTDRKVWGVVYEKRSCDGKPGERGILINTRNQGFDKRIPDNELRCSDLPSWVESEQPQSCK